MVIMKWKEAFNPISGMSLRRFREQYYPSLPDDYIESSRRFYAAGAFWISVSMFLLGFYLGYK